MLFDSHAHITSSRFDKNRDELIKEIEDSQLSYVMDIGCDLESSVKAAEIAKQYDWCYAAVGCHPHEADDMDDMTIEMFRSLAKKQDVKAIGEIGLDYHYYHSTEENQQYWFREQIKLALELKMPIVIHDREANDDVLRILKEEGVFKKERTDCFPVKPDGRPDARLLLHCFSGSAELAAQYEKLGATISIAGPVTYKNARKTVEAVEVLDITNILIETDSPYLTPEPFRGKINKPILVEHTAAKIAQIKNMSYEEVARITCCNAKRFFDIK